jgi:hypothetical protein
MLIEREKERQRERESLLGTVLHKKWAVCEDKVGEEEVFQTALPCDGSWEV